MWELLRLANHEHHEDWWVWNPTLVMHIDRPYIATDHPPRPQTRYWDPARRQLHIPEWVDTIQRIPHEQNLTDPPSG